MTPQPPQDPEQRLLQLLSLTRYEVPPPGFFDRLPRQVLVSIRAGVEVQDRAWWERLRDLLVREPMVAGSYAALGLGALLFGVSVFETARGTAETSPVVFQGSLEGASAFVPPTPDSLPSGVIYRVVQPAPSQEWIAAGGLPALRVERIEYRSDPGLFPVQFQMHGSSLR